MLKGNGEIFFEKHVMKKKKKEKGKFWLLQDLKLLEEETLELGIL